MILNTTKEVSDYFDKITQGADIDDKDLKRLKAKCIVYFNNYTELGGKYEATNVAIIIANNL